LERLAPCESKEAMHEGPGSLGGLKSAIDKALFPFSAEALSLQQIKAADDWR
jgi:hypothetical protein